MQDHPLFSHGDIAVLVEFDPESAAWSFHPPTLDPEGSPGPTLLTGYACYDTDAHCWIRPDADDEAEAIDRCWIHHALRVEKEAFIMSIKKMFHASDVHAHENGDIWVSNRERRVRGRWLTRGEIMDVADRLREVHDEKGWLDQ